MRVRSPFFAPGLFIALALAFAFLPGPASAEIPEPQGYWMGPMHSEVPATLTGARVLGTQALAQLLQQGDAVLVDAAEAPRRPENLAPGAIWKPVPHHHIPGSVWIPGIGAGKIEPRLEAYYRERLIVLTASVQTHKIVFYCHPQCWASWNAAKRALSYGYQNIFWYRDGAEGWQEAGHALAEARPEGP
ncbi:MAG: rhodanese-like domain-containing protein [Beijerinckiaceae bacterium]|nr:rhodanese-like domain-containing protein [Beijerinckiaceae bacterium]